MLQRSQRFNFRLELCHEALKAFLELPLVDDFASKVGLEFLVDASVACRGGANSKDFKEFVLGEKALFGVLR